VDLTQYRQRDLEKKRAGDLMRLIPKGGYAVLDVGARDGYFSKLLVEHFNVVTALDLEEPSIRHQKIRCVKGDITRLDYDDNCFDLVFCAEVLEHIPTPLLEKACGELSRVAKTHLLIGVPYKQDLRLGRTTCYCCGKKNPPWGHVNTFDENRLQNLFPKFDAITISLVGETNKRTNVISTFLMDLAGNPYGTYSQEEPCIHCGEKLKNPPPRNLLKKMITKIAFYAQNIQKPFIRPQANWIHVLFQKRMA
jgi:ubiquinone/menaquinone biosynthesis C-methylase UbiE